MHFFLVHDFGWLHLRTKDLDANYKKQNKLKMMLALSEELPLLSKKRLQRPTSYSS